MADVADDLVTRISVQGVPAVVSSLQQLAAAYRQLEKIANSNPVTAAAWKEARTQLGFVGTQAVRTGTQVAQSGMQLQQMGAKAGQAGQALQVYAPKVHLAARANMELQKSIGFVRQEMHNVGVRAHQWGQNLAAPFRTLGNVLPAIGHQVRSFFTSLANSFKYMAVGGAIATGAFLTKAIGMVAQQQTTAIGFKTLLGSQAATNQLMAQNQRWADVSPWGLNEANSLASALLIAQVPAQNLQKVMNDVGNAVASVGGTPDVLNRVGLNLQEIASNRAINSIDLRQFSSAKIDARGAISKALGITPEALEAMMGADGGNQAVFKAIGGVEGLARALGSLHPDAMLEQSKSLIGLWSTLKDRMNRGIKEGLDPLIPLLSQYIKNLTPVVEAGAKVFASMAQWIVGKLPGALNAMRPALAWVLNAFADTIAWGQKNWEKIHGVIQKLIGAFKDLARIAASIFTGPVMTAVTAFVAPALIGGLTLLAGALSLIAEHADGLSSVLTVLVPLLAGATVAKAVSKDTKTGWLARKGASAITGGVAGLAIKSAIGVPVSAGVTMVLAGAIGPLAVPVGAAAGLGVSYLAGKIGEKHPGVVIGTVVALVGGLSLALWALYRNSKGVRDIWDTLWTVGSTALKAVRSVLAGVTAVLNPIVRFVFELVKLFTKIAISPLMVGLRLAGLAMRALLFQTRMAVRPFELLVHLVQRLVHWIGNIKWPTPPRWLRDVVGAPAAVFRQGQRASGWVERLLGDAGSPRMFAGSARFHQNVTGRSPGLQAVTSGYRTTMLGSANSDHLRGAYDVAGTGLGGYAAAVNASGGSAAMHGGSHLHVVPPMGDAGSPRTAPGSFTGRTGNSYTLQIFPQTAMDLRKEVRQLINELERDDVERLRLTSNRMRSA